MATPDQDDLGGMTLPTSPRQNAPAPPPTFPTLHVSQEPFNFVKNYIPTESPPKPMVHAGNKHKLSTGNLLSGLGNSAGNLFGLGNSAGNLFEAIGFGVSSSGSSSMPTVAVQPGGQRAAALSPIDHEVHHDKRQRRVPWTNTEDVTILALHRRLGTQWDKIAAQLPGRTADAVRNRCFRLQKQHPMATAPDALDGLLMATHGIEPPTDDAEAAHAKGRGVSTEHGRHAWSPDEDKIIVEGVNKLGCKWREIAKFLPGRTDSMCRNRWMRLQKERYDERTDSGRAASPPPPPAMGGAPLPVRGPSLPLQPMPMPIPVPATSVVAVDSSVPTNAAASDVAVTFDELTAAATAAVDDAPAATTPETVPLGLGSPEEVFDLECFSNIAFEVEAAAEAEEAAAALTPRTSEANKPGHTRIGAAFLAAFAALSFGGLAAAKSRRS